MEATALNAQLEGQIGTLWIQVNIDTMGGPLVVVGPNGAGKTSILLMLLGILRPHSARIEVGGTILVDTSSHVDVAVEYRRLGYVPQDYALFPHLTVRRNIEFAFGSSSSRCDRKARSQRAEALMAELRLEPLADRRSLSLSGGEKQRVALARALSIAPRALLLDEPLAALDVGAKREVRAALAFTLANLGLPTVIVTHDAEDARALGHRIAVVEAGRVVQTGTWADLKARPASAFVEEFVAVG
jgi:molybdate transport system ATP-binding protein